MSILDKDSAMEDHWTDNPRFKKTTMTKEEALKLALEALENELAVDMSNYAEVGEAAEQMYEAIAAIKEALAQPEQEPVATYTCGVCGVSLQMERPWVGLTDEERNDILNAYITADGRSRAIEAKLKEKNT